MGEVRACCESVAGRAVSIEYPSNLRDRLATDAVHRIRVDSLPPAKLAYFGSIRKDQNVSVRVDQDVLYIEGPKNACLEYERIVKAAFLHTVDSGLAPEVVSFLSTTPAKDNLKEVARSLQCACFAPDTSSATRLTIISESEADADTCKVQLKRRYTVDSTTSADHAILHTDAKDAWECMKDCIELDNPGVRILLEGNTVKLVGEQKGITSIQMYVREQISQFLVTDAVMELSKDHFEVMKHSSKWRDVVEDLEKQPDCKVIQHQSADPKGDVRIRIRGKPENMQKIQGRITEMRKSLVTKAVYVDRPGIQKIFRSDSCGPVHVSRPSPDCSALITCNSVQPLRDVFRVERGKLSSQRVSVANFVVWNFFNPPFTWHFESGLSHSHAQANPDSIGIRSRLNPDYRILVRRWIISGFRCEIVQSRSQAPERARKVGGKGDAYGASFPNSLKSCAGAAIIITYPNKE